MSDGILPQMMGMAAQLIRTHDDQMQAVVGIKALAEDMQQHAGAIGHQTLLAADAAIIDAATGAIEGGQLFASKLADLAHSIQDAGGQL